MASPLTRKLEAFAPLPKADKRLLDEVVRSAYEVGAHEDLIQEGDDPSSMYLVLEGFACRYKLLPSGKRQIVAYFVPGDLCDLHMFILRAMDHSIATLSPCKVVDIPQGRILDMTARPALARALWWALLVDEAVLREWLVGIGGRSAEQRMAHLLCEIWMRLRTVGLTSDGSYDLPLTQAELADALGLSHIHTNRVLQRLRRQGLIMLSARTLTISDVSELEAFSGFNPTYLHLDEGRGNGTKQP